MKLIKIHEGFQTANITELSERVSLHAYPIPIQLFEAIAHHFVISQKKKKKVLSMADR